MSPHDAPAAMTVPLLILAAGTVLAGFLGLPAALGGEDVLGRFLAPVFEAAAGHHAAGGHGAEAAVMIVSALVAAAGMLAARHLFLTRPEVPAALVRRWPRAHALLRAQFYLDALYQAAVVRGTLAAARGLHATDRTVVDGAVDGAGAVTRTGAWLSHMADKHLVDGLVNGIGRGAGRGSFLVRRLQTGLVQNYALLMVFGLFAFLTLYLLGG